ARPGHPHEVRRHEDLGAGRERRQFERLARVHPHPLSLRRVGRDRPCPRRPLPVDFFPRLGTMGFLRRLRRPRLWLGALALALVALAGVYGWGCYHYGAAQEALKQERYRDARDHARQCLAVWPRSPAAHLLAARVERHDGAFDVAEEYLNR